MCPRELILRMCYFFRKCLGDCNIECWLQCISSFSDCVSVTKFVHAHAFRCVIGIHAWRAGRLLLGLRKFKLIYIFLTIKGIGTSFWFNNIWGCLGRPELLVMIGWYLSWIPSTNHNLGHFPFVRTDRPDHSHRNDNFPFNQNYPARSVKS